MRRVVAVGFVLALALLIGARYGFSVDAPQNAGAAAQPPPSAEERTETARAAFVVQGDAPLAGDSNSPALGAVRQRQQARLDDVARRVGAQRRRLADAGVSPKTLAAIDAHADRLQARQRKPVHIDTGSVRWLSKAATK